MTVVHFSFLFSLAVTFIGAPFCIFKGGPAERLGAALILVFYVADDLAFAIISPFPSFAAFAMDFGLAVGLLVVALRYTSLWLGGAMLVQSLNLCLESIWLDGDNYDRLTRDIFINVLTVAMIACIIAGTVASLRKRARLRRTAQPAGALTSSILT